MAGDDVPIDTTDASRLLLYRGTGTEFSGEDVSFLGVFHKIAHHSGQVVAVPRLEQPSIFPIPNPVQGPQVTGDDGHAYGLGLLDNHAKGLAPQGGHDEEIELSQGIPNMPVIQRTCKAHVGVPHQVFHCGCVLGEASIVPIDGQGHIGWEFVESLYQYVKALLPGDGTKEAKVRS
jgi:hypothetical protein